MGNSLMTHPIKSRIEGDRVMMKHLVSICLTVDSVIIVYYPTCYKAAGLLQKVMETLELHSEGLIWWGAS